MTLPAILALVAAFGYGLGDFIAGMLSRRVHFAVVAVLAGIAALVTTVIAVGLLTPVQPTRDALLWGAASGIGTALGTLALFRGTRSLHRVSPVVEGPTRLIALLSFDRDPGMVFPAKAQLNNTGRTTHG